MIMPLSIIFLSLSIFGWLSVSDFIFKSSFVLENSDLLNFLAILLIFMSFLVAALNFYFKRDALFSLVSFGNVLFSSLFIFHSYLAIKILFNKTFYIDRISIWGNDIFLRRLWYKNDYLGAVESMWPSDIPHDNLPEFIQIFPAFDYFEIYKLKENLAGFRTLYFHSLEASLLNNKKNLFLSFSSKINDSLQSLFINAGWFCYNNPAIIVAATLVGGYLAYNYLGVLHEAVLTLSRKSTEVWNAAAAHNKLIKVTTDKFASWIENLHGWLPNWIKGVQQQTENLTAAVNYNQQTNQILLETVKNLQKQIEHLKASTVEIVNFINNGLSPEELRNTLSVLSYSTVQALNEIRQFINVMHPNAGPHSAAYRAIEAVENCANVATQIFKKNLVHAGVSRGRRKITSLRWVGKTTCS